LAAGVSAGTDGIARTRPASKRNEGRCIATDCSAHFVGCQETNVEAFLFAGFE
jgi:hypothetical protein